MPTEHVVREASRYGKSGPAGLVALNILLLSLGRCSLFRECSLQEFAGGTRSWKEGQMAGRW